MKIAAIVAEPRTRGRLERLIGTLPAMANLRLVDPVPYLDSVQLMANARCVLTDSGGIQEKTTALQAVRVAATEISEQPLTLVGVDPRHLEEKCLESEAKGRPLPRQNAVSSWRTRHVESGLGSALGAPRGQRIKELARADNGAPAKTPKDLEESIACHDHLGLGPQRTLEDAIVGVVVGDRGLGLGRDDQGRKLTDCAEELELAGPPGPPPAWADPKRGARLRQANRQQIAWGRIAQDGTRVRASAGAASFRREETLEALMQQAREHLAAVTREAADPAISALRTAARKRGAQQRLDRVEAALQQLPEVTEAKKRSGAKDSTGRVSTTDPDAQVMKMGDGGSGPPSTCSSPPQPTRRVSSWASGSPTVPHRSVATWCAGVT